MQQQLLIFLLNANAVIWLINSGANTVMAIIIPLLLSASIFYAGKQAGKTND